MRKNRTWQFKGRRTRWRQLIADGDKDGAEVHIVPHE